MALKKINLEISGLTGGLLRDAGIRLQSERPADLLRNEALEQENTELKTQVGALQQENTELKTLAGALQQENTELKTLAGALQQENTKLKLLAAALQQENTELKTLADELRKQLAARDGELRKLRTQLDAARTAMPQERTVSRRDAGRRPAGGGERPRMTARAGAGASCHAADEGFGNSAGRRKYLYKLFREMGELWTPQWVFTFLAARADGFDRQRLRGLAMLIRARRKCQGGDDFTDVLLGRCIDDIRKLSLPQLKKCARFRLFSK